MAQKEVCAFVEKKKDGEEASSELGRLKRHMAQSSFVLTTDSHPLVLVVVSQLWRSAWKCVAFMPTTASMTNSIRLADMYLFGRDTLAHFFELQIYKIILSHKV